VTFVTHPTGRKVVARPEKEHDSVVKNMQEAIHGLGEHAQRPADPHAGTRERVARSILENGPSTAAVLGERLGLTPAAVRRHLDTLLADGVIEGREQRVYGHRGRGRPAKVFFLTDSGRDEFEQAYDDLAVSAMRFMAEAGIADQFVRERIGAQETRYREAIDSAKQTDRVALLASLLTSDGYAASSAKSPVVDGEQLCQHHCPVAHVAEQFPQLCDAETEAFARLLGTHVQRLSTIAHGDGVCTTHIPSHIPGQASKSPKTASEPTNRKGSRI
jgi:predicted ArsR family transcriptional regulator